jgi:hypothetical protein
MDEARSICDSAGGVSVHFCQGPRPIALIASVKPQTELEALLAVQIAATGFASLKFLQLGQRHLEDAYIEVYGGYGTRLLRLQLELIQALDKHRRGRRGNKQTVEVRHVHIHPGGQGVVGIINSLKDGGSLESQQNAERGAGTHAEPERGAGTHAKRRRCRTADAGCTGECPREHRRAIKTLSNMVSMDTADSEEKTRQA